MPTVAVCFDCDSTLTALEGLDELAVAADAVEAVANITEQAMAGALSLSEAIAQRMDLIRPDARALARLASAYASSAVAGAREAISQLRADGCAIRIVSSGLRPAIVPFAAELGVAEDEVSAIDVRLDAAGCYAGYDRSSELAQDDGKARVCRRLKQDDGFATVIMVGEGSNDAAAAAGGAVFVQFAGVCDRPQVAKQADWRLAGPGMAGLPALVRRIAAG